MKAGTTGIAGLALAAAAACGGSVAPTLFDDFGSFNGARIEVVSTGGFAGLSQSEAVTHDDRRFVHVLRRICTNICAAPMDSASGTLSVAATDSVFTIALANMPALKDDYGFNGAAADAAAYVVRLSNASGAIKTVRGDDTTMPPELRRVVEALRGTISAARK